MKEGYKDIADYGLIGNLETCALVGKDGSIDWLCLPYLDSPSVFAAILDAKKGGSFSVRPSDSCGSRQEYIYETNILRTFFDGASGAAALTDFMPVRDTPDAARAIIRKLEGSGGKMPFEIIFRPEFDYASSGAELSLKDGAVAAEKGGESLWLSVYPEVKFSISNRAASASFSLEKGKAYWIVLSYGVPEGADCNECNALLERDISFWRGWTERSRDFYAVTEERWRGAVIRSSLVLKLLSDIEYGSVAAAPTTSLPEVIGGVRNWDYRFAWIRDMSFTVETLFHMGHEKEYNAFHKWVGKVMGYAHDPGRLAPLYTLKGKVAEEEKELPQLSGYRGSKPVRVGNRASSQLQLDIYGELVGAVYEALRHGRRASEEDWSLIKKIAGFVCENWHREDSGIWELRGRPRHFVYSKVMCWVAVDKAIKIAELMGFETDKEWAKAREAIKDAVLEEGFSNAQGSFTRIFGSEKIDATGLLIGHTGFLPFQDARIQGTLDAVMRDLMVDGCLVYRHLDDDGLPGKEGVFLICSFWLIRALASSGRIDEAERIFEKILSYSSPLGLFSEEVDRASGKLLGNYPQAYSHIGLINAALYLGIAKGGRHRGPKPMGL
jgi:pentatricopeptide repeat protein